MTKAGPNSILIIGMAGRYPGAVDLDVFARNIEECHSAIEPIPEERIRQCPKQRTWRGGFVSLPGRSSTRYVSKELGPGRASRAAIYLHEIIKSALDDANISSSLPREQIGLWVAYDRNRHSALSGGSFDSTQSLQQTSISSWLSRTLDFRGPSLDVDTKCSSALAALQSAVNAILCGSCEIAVVGAVSVDLEPQVFMELERAGVLSRQGEVLALSDRADGWVPGEGCGAVILTRTSRNSSHKAYAQICAVEVGHAGRVDGIVPINLGQRTNLICRALTNAQLEPANIIHIELHAIGDRLGDAVEITAFSQALSCECDVKWSIGTLAPLIGHLEAASGLAALHKAILMIVRGVIPPLAIDEPVNAALTSANERFFINRKPGRWPESQSQTAVLVSSYGNSGVAAIAVLCGVV